ncbi:MAG: winged helix-turn-helix domain-containing protein [Vibrio sp.]
MYKRLSIDTVRRTITLIDSEASRDNQPLELNRSEYNLLLAFCDSHGEVIDKQALIELGWPGRVVGDNSLAVAIMKLRKKLDSLEMGFEINNLPGEGYIFINSKNIEIGHEKSLETSPVLEAQEPRTSDTETRGNQVVLDQNNSEESVTQTMPPNSRVKKLIRTPLFWEISLGIIIGVITFFFMYREAFECFDCFGGGR